MLLVPAFGIAVCILAACEEEKHSYVDNIGDPKRTPTMVTTDVSTTISDSGYTRYHITTPVWNMFEETDDPFWTFPEGLHLDQFDQNMQPDANIVCDSAIYWSQRRLWRLDGDVVMVNTLRDSFLTQQLFWDQARAEVYSDSFIHIVRESHIIEGYGFRSNQNMTAYTVNRPTAIIPIENRNNSGVGRDTIDSYEADAIRRGERPSAPRPASARIADEEKARNELINQGYVPIKSGNTSITRRSR